MDVKNISHLYEFDGQLDQLGLNKAQCIKGFDPNNLFSTHVPCWIFFIFL